MSSNLNSSTTKLYITNLDHVGPFLKISGQLNRDAVNVVHTRTLQLLPACFVIDPSWSLQRQQALITPGTFCLFKRTNGAAPADCDFLRACVINAIVDGTQKQAQMTLRVEVEFLDFGYTATVTSYELLFPKQPQLIQSIPILCTNYIMLGICAEWKKQEIEDVLRLIINETVEITIAYERFNQKFININWKDFDFAEYLIQQKMIGAPISNDLQLDHFEKLIKDNPQMLPATTKVASNNNNNNNNNNYYYSNNNINNNQVPKSATELAREQLAARRSLAARLEQHRQPGANTVFVAPEVPRTSTNVSLNTVPTMVQSPQPRYVQPLGLIRTMLHGVNNINNRIPYTGLPYAQPQAHLTMQVNGFGNMPTKPMETYHARFEQPRLMLPEQLSIQRPIIALSQQRPYQQDLSVRSPKAPAVFKYSPLTIGNTYDVIVSFVENGPYCFSVQLKNTDEELTAMMNRMENIRLTPLKDPNVGMACVARFSEDNNLYRALISGVYQNSCRVLYVDYGNSETVTHRDLYVIPTEFLEAKPYSMRFMLSGTKQLEPIDYSLKKAFKDMVLYNVFKLKVMPLEGPPLVQYCELSRNNINILESMRQIKEYRLVYPKAEPLKTSDIVEIRYIDSPRNFYVQKQDNIKEFEQLMDEMFVYYNTNQVVPEKLWLGSPCIVKYENEWYRAEIMRNDPKAIVVRHVDFGYEQRVTRNLLSTIAPKHLKMPRQAVQCCLKGFENNELEKSVATDQFEMLAEESNLCRRLFTVHVFRIQPDGVNIVNLTAKNLNVMKKLYKLSMPFEQYLTLEREEFNSCGFLSNHSKTPSITSSNDCANLDAQKKKGILNSTSLQSDERTQQQKPQQQQQRIKQNNTNKSDSDKQSNSSAKENRDSRSSSSEHQPRLNAGKGNRPQYQVQQQQQQLSPRQLLQVGRSSKTDTSFDSRSNGSGGSSFSNGSRFNKQQAEKQVPPRFQNGKREAINQSHQSKSPSPRKHGRQLQQQQQQQLQEQKSNEQNNRSQNAPQGFAQKPQRQKSTLNAGAISKKSSGTDSVSINSDSSTTSQTEVYLPLDHAFPTEDIKLPANEEVIICWWVSPHQFYIQLKSKVAQYDKMLREIQIFYKQKPHQQLQLKVGSYVMARYRKENVIQRARLLACNQMLRKYKVYFVDMGTQYTVTSEDIWQVEQRFATLPCMAYRCSFDGIISNYDHLYIIDHMDKLLPQGATIKCKFLRQQQSTYFVNALVNGVSLKATLIKDGFVTEVAESINIELLAGQQIRGKITFIKDMLNFKIQLEGSSLKVQFLCAFDDVRYVKSNADMAKKFKQFYEGKSCIFNIKEVNENKVLMLRPMMPLFKEDIPSYISTHPIIFREFKASTVYIATAYRLYVQPVEIENDMDTLLNDMFKYYQKEGKKLNKIEKDQICAAHSSDDNWYRARVVSTNIAADNESSSVEVFYIDYGNYEKLPKNSLCILADQFYLNKNAYAIEVNLPIGQYTNEAAVKTKLDEIAMEKIVTIKPIKFVSNHLIADVIVTDDKYAVELLLASKLIKTRDVDNMRKTLEKEKPNMLEYIETVDLTLEEEDDEKKLKKSTSATKKPVPVVKEATTPVVQEIEKDLIKPIEKQTTAPKKSIESNSSSASSTAAVEPAVKTNEAQSTSTTTPAVAVVESKPPTPVLDPYADMVTAVLSHCDNPAQFYVHMQDKIEELQKLQENLQIVSPSLPQLDKVEKGAQCISLYSVDKQWYRAKILDAELMVLRFIDFGNTDCVSDTTDVKESMWSHEKPYCIPCALPIRPNGTADWVDAANAIFNDSYTKLLHFEYITNGDHERVSYINLFIEGINVAEKLIADGLAKPLELISSGENCYISHVNSISDFYIQYEKDGKALELIEIYLSNAKEQLQPLKKFEKSLIVAALFKDDQLWYRAELLREVASGGYEVRFIDYGNTSISPECRLVSEEIAKVPALSKKCQLELPENCEVWSDEADKKFAEIAATGETIFTVILRQPAADRVHVHLLIDDHNIVDDLAPLCAKKESVPLSNDINISINSANTSSLYEDGAQMSALVTQVDSPLDFFVQLNKDSARVDHIVSSLNDMTLEKIQSPAVVGQLCAVRCFEDNVLYRARVLEVQTAADKQKQLYNVIFIDYGQEVITSELYELPQDLRDLNPLAKHCQLEFSRKFTQMPAVATETFNALLDSCDFTVKLEYLDKDISPMLVKLFTNDNKALNICKQLHELLDNAQDSIVNEANTVKKCIISHANSPSSFYIQLKDSSCDLEFISKTLQKSRAEKLEILDEVIEGITAICYSPEDGYYCRCSVLHIFKNKGIYRVHLLDFGNSIDVKELRRLPTQISRIPALAVHCSLNDIPQNVEATKLNEAFNSLLEAHFGELYELKSIKRKIGSLGEPNIVELQIDYKDITEELTNLITGAVQSPLPTLYECGIVQYNGAASFYIQLVDDTDALEHITDKLLDAEHDFSDFTALKVGAICAAEFPEDGAYYRARILNVLDDDQCEVHFIDFGNTSITDKFRKLPDDLRDLEHYSKHCKLDEDAIAKCDAAQLQEFIEPRFSETFQVEFLTTTEPRIVRLFYQGKNVIDECRRQWQEKHSPSSGELSLE